MLCGLVACLVAVTKHLAEAAPGRKHLFWLTVERHGVHHGREDIQARA